MKIGSFGPIVFETGKRVYTFDGLTYESSLSIQSEKTDGSKPGTISEDLELDNISFKLKLSAPHGVIPRRELEKWVALKDSKQKNSFILGSKPFGGLWQLTSVKMSDAIFLGNGSMYECMLELTAQEYDHQGKKKDKDKVKKKTTSTITKVDFKPARKSEGRMF